MIGGSFGVMLLVGIMVMVGAATLLGRLGAPGWVIVAAWVSATGSVMLWTFITPTPADRTDYEGQGWTEYVVRFIMIGEDSPREVPMRIITGVLFGAPVAAMSIILGLLAIVGIT